jgi:hypothetical protein
VDGIPLGSLTPIGALCLVLALPYLQLARGKLHPQSTIDRMTADHAREMADISHDRDEWRAAHRISETARQVAADQVDELLEHARTTDAFIRALPNPSQERP